MPDIGSKFTDTYGKDFTVSDINLEDEAFTYQGERLTEDRAAQLQEAAQKRLANLKPGRKSLTGGNVHSPRVQFRVPDQLSKHAHELADREGVSLSQLARKALEEYVASH